MQISRPEFEIPFPARGKKKEKKKYLMPLLMLFSDEITFSLSLRTHNANIYLEWGFMRLSLWTK